MSLPDVPFASDPVAYGEAAAKIALAGSLDGIEITPPALAPGCTAGGTDAPGTIAWLVAATNAAAGVLGPAGGLVTHGPQASAFSQVGGAGQLAGPSGCYTAVYLQAAATIDWLSVQVRA